MNLPTKVVSRDSTESGVPTGGTRLCQLESCGGLRIGVRWSNGKLTWPCTKGMDTEDAQVWRIV
jgi:hypothetical protein